MHNCIQKPLVRLLKEITCYSNEAEILLTFKVFHKNSIPHPLPEHKITEYA